MKNTENTTNIYHIHRDEFEEEEGASSLIIVEYVGSRIHDFVILHVSVHRVAPDGTVGKAHHEESFDPEAPPTDFAFDLWVMMIDDGVLESPEDYLQVGPPDGTEPAIFYKPGEAPPEEERNKKWTCPHCGEEA